MTAFFHDSNLEQQQVLIGRMIALREAVIGNLIQADDLQTVSKLSTADLQAKTADLLAGKLDTQDATNSAVKKLYDVLQSAKSVHTPGAERFMQVLKQFDQEHGEYLPLQPLASQNKETLAYGLNDFALFYSVFIQYMTCQKEVKELGDEYALDIDQQAAKTAWLGWKKTRNARITFDPQSAGLPGVLEKFLAGRLTKDEWLSDLDIERGLKILDLNKYGTHIIPCSVEDIGQALHFEREKHQLDNPKTPYCIPLILNLGAPGLASRGQHWTRMLVTVDPTVTPLKVTVKYTDELPLSAVSTKKIKDLISAALKYRVEQGNYTDKQAMKIYSAFPECETPKIHVVGSGEQRDGYTCGYRALRGIVSDLVESGFLTANQDTQELINCNNSDSLRDYVFRTLIGRQAIAPAEHEQMKKLIPSTATSANKENEYYVNPTLIDGQILAFSQPGTKTRAKPLTKMLDNKYLEQLVVQNQVMMLIRGHECIQKFVKSQESAVSVNIADILKQPGVQAENNPSLVIEVLMAAIKNNSAISQITVNGTQALSPSLLTTLISQFNKLGPNVKLISTEVNLQSPISVIDARNSLLNDYNVANALKKDEDPWDKLFTAMLFSIPTDAVNGVFHYKEDALKKLGTLGFDKFLQFMAENQDQFSTGPFQYQVLDLHELGFDYLNFLKKHLESPTPFFPFKSISFKLTDCNKVKQADLLKQLKEILPLLQKNNVDKITLLLDQEAILQDDLLQFIQKQKITTIVSIEHNNNRLLNLENAALLNKKADLNKSEKNIGKAVTDNAKTVVLGKVGKAVFRRDGIGALDTEVQVQQQQQQQIQQQIQTALNDEDLPEEDVLIPESFPMYRGTDVLLDRAGFVIEMAEFIKNRHPHLTPEQCWDMICGENAHLFKYGINKMTRDAAKMLCEHLQDIQYGLHPDNLPQGFSLQQDQDGNIVLEYTRENPTTNPSPLTLVLGKPRLANQWAGDSLQFIDAKQAKELYALLFAKKSLPKPTEDACIRNFFYIKDLTVDLNNDERLTILDKLINDTQPGILISTRLKKLFGKSLTQQNIAALSEILYEQGPAALSEFVLHLEKLKANQGEPFFTSFKACFIDSSKNLNELANKAAYDAITKLSTFSEAQKAWWIALTEQHTSNLAYDPKSKHEPGKRWTDLANLADAFVHFCGQLTERYPGLNLPLYCPLMRVADLRTGLDRLLSTILANAQNLNEQFYESLEDLSLAPLGPFYASRYEGFKWVSAEMQLDLGSLSGKADYDRRKFAGKEATYRCDKENISDQFADMNIRRADQKKALFYRYIATFNHRAPMQQYNDAFNKISNEISSELGGGNLVDSLLVLVAMFGTGKRGKNFQGADIDALLTFINNHIMDKDNRDQIREENVGTILFILDTWRQVRSASVKPTIAEVLAISEYAYANPEITKAEIYKVRTFIILYRDRAQNYLDTLVLLSKNKRGMPINFIHQILTQIQALDLKLDLQVKSQMIKLFGVCDSHDLIVEDINGKSDNLCTLIKTFQDKFGIQTTCDLLELFANIDLESNRLPTLDQITHIIAQITAGKSLSYAELEQAVKSQLPDQCKIITSNIKAAAVEPAGNMHAVMAKYMAEIREQLAPYQEQIDEQMGVGFYDGLAGADGAKILLDSLASIKDLPALIRNMISSKVKAVMLKVYESVLNDGMSHVKIKDESSKNCFVKLITKKLSHPIQSIDDFDQFVTSFASEITALQQLLTNFKTINQKWPLAIDKIVALLDDAKLSHYSLTLLSKITDCFAKYFDADQPFPLETMSSFVAFVDPDVATQTAIQDIIDCIFDSERLKASGLTDLEKQLTCQVSLKYCHTKPAMARDFTERLLALQVNDQKYFAATLQLMLASDNLDNDFPNIVKEMQKLMTLNDPNLMTSVLSLFAKEHGKNFLPFMALLKECPPARVEALLKIIVSATDMSIKKNKSYQFAEQHSILQALLKLDDKTVNDFVLLFNSPKHPDMAELDSILKKPVVDVSSLEEHYDRDPWNKRDLELLSKQFDCSQLSHYLDQSMDMNYDRPLLLSQRQELQQWYLYINTIGKDKPIHTKPWAADKSQLKAVIEMSHGEIQGLLNYYRSALRNPNLSKEQQTKTKLELIAILREVMYRATGNMPRPTQVLYLLMAMQGNKDFIAQIPTGQGKSMTAALAAAFSQLQGKTVDVCTSNLSLAHEGMEENKDFFAYLNIPVELIHANSGLNDYQKGAIHYSSMSEMALHRSKMQLQGKLFPKDCTLVVDEVDFSTLDDNTRYRYATSLDPVTDPYASPYTWIYEALIQFVDNQKAPLTDADLITEAKKHLSLCAATRDQKNQLKGLNESGEIFQKRLETWLIAAGKTAQLVEMEQSKFRIVTLTHPKFNKVSKACILSGGRPHIQAEFSNGIQQFLHVRLRQKYREQIDNGTVPDFLVEPEKTYITSLNSKILMNSYSVRLGMSGTVGSPQEIKEQYAKYGFRFIDIPPFADSNRIDLPPILSNAKFIHNPDAEDADHIKRIVKDALRHLLKEPGQLSSPMLILCADKIQGEKIAAALRTALLANPKKYKNQFRGVDDGIQQYYSSEEQTAQLRNLEENTYKQNAALDGMITISTVFDRGTDIKPRHEEGLYTVQTYVDTQPYSAEDLERAKRQKIGRSGRAGQIGYTRLIVKRSEFKDVYDEMQMRRIPETVPGLDVAIRDLNHLRNSSRLIDRELRESFDDIKELIYQKFFPYITSINASDPNAPKREIRDVILKQWNLILGNIDEKWSEIENVATLNTEQKLEKLTAFACNEWNQFSKAGGLLESKIQAWAQRHNVTLVLPTDQSISVKEVLNQIKQRHPQLAKQYIKTTQMQSSVDPNVSSDVIYCNFMSQDPLAQNPSTQAVMTSSKLDVLTKTLQDYDVYLNSSAYKNKLQGKFNTNALDIKEIMGALLYLRYKAFRDGNHLGFIALNKKCREFKGQIIWLQDPACTQDILNAEQDHFTILSNRRGQHETKKNHYLDLFMSQAQHTLPLPTNKWKTSQFPNWWSTARTHVIESLTQYRDNWWDRSWVSSDRKNRVNILLTKLNLNPKASAAEILKMISETRADILADDTANNRSLKSSVSGKLFVLLDQIENRVRAASDAGILDDDIAREFSDINAVLDQFRNRLTAKFPKMAFTFPHFDIVAFNNVKPADKLVAVIQHYQKLAEFFQDVLLLGDINLNRDDVDMQALFDYCQNKHNQLPFFFGQCNTLRQVNLDRSVQVYRAVCKAIESFMQQVMQKKDEKQQLALPKKILYRDVEVKCTTDDQSVIKHDPFFMRINNAKSYATLLHAVEKSIVESLPNTVLIKFKSIVLGKSEKFNDNAFKLTINMLLDGVDTKIHYHFDLKTHSISCDQDSFTHLGLAASKEPALDSISAHTAIHGIIDYWDQLKDLGAELNDDVKKQIASFDKEFGAALFERYDFELRQAAAEKRKPLDFKEFVEKLKNQHINDIASPKPKP